MLCKHCNTENVISSRFCKGCMMPLEESPLNRGHRGNGQRRRKPRKNINMTREYIKRVLHLTLIGVVLYLCLALIFKGLLPFITDKAQNYVEEGELTQVLRNITVGEQAFNEAIDMVLSETRQPSSVITVEVTEDTPLDNLISPTNLTDLEANVYVEVVKQLLKEYMGATPQDFQSKWSVIQARNVVEITSKLSKGVEENSFKVHLDTSTQTITKLEFNQ